MYFQTYAYVSLIRGSLIRADKYIIKKIMLSMVLKRQDNALKYQIDDKKAIVIKLN